MQTINQFFNLRNGSKEWISRIVNSPEYAPVKRSMAHELQGYPRPAVLDRLVARQLADLLDVDLSHVLVAAWRKHEEIIKYRDSDKYPPGEVNLVPLAEHTVSSQHSPSIQPIINEIHLPPITFDVTLKLTLKGAMLKILDARIIEILVGSCTGNGSVTYAGQALVERETAPVNFPGSIALKKGIAI